MSGAALLPRWAWGPFAVGAAVLLVPILGLLSRAPWARMGELLASEPARDALLLSLGTCLASTLVVLLLGVPMALVLARSTGRWVPAARALVAVPMVLPPVVAGLALVTTLGRRGLLGAPLAVAGIEIGFTTAAVVVAQTFVALPFLVISLEGALRSAGTDHDRAAARLGAPPTTVFWRVTVPLAAPAIASGTALAFARALGEFGATLTFAGSLQGVTRTLPLEIYLLREADTELSLALAVVLLAVAAVVVVVAVGRRRPGG